MQDNTPKTHSQDALNALNEAKARRAKIDADAHNAAPIKEINGRVGAEAVRYGDWENKGIACDF